MHHFSKYSRRSIPLNPLACTACDFAACIYTLLKNLPAPSGVSRISFRGGVQNFSGKVGEFAWREAPCSAWRSHAFARGVRGYAPPRKF